VPTILMREYSAKFGRFDTAHHGTPAVKDPPLQ
jgi:hypothetical protein